MKQLPLAMRLRERATFEAFARAAVVFAHELRALGVAKGAASPCADTAAEAAERGGVTDTRRDAGTPTTFATPQSRM